MILRRLMHAFLLLCLALTLPGASPVAAQDGVPGSVDDILAGMSPEERVGQLFLVTFSGTDAGPDSAIYDLVVNHHVGGVVLQADHDNFQAAPYTVTGAYELIVDLQRLEWDTTFLPPAGAKDSQPRVYVPLFIGISQEGDGWPNDQILEGLTPQPTLMALGATWDPDLAQRSGDVLGNELAAIGFNLYLGPSLDVLETPVPGGSSDLGTRVFGGDPYWVGRMGQSFINGLHSGSDGRLLVIAKHFPGRGGSDRPPELEVATVRKSLEQLKQIELAPFFAVTDSPLSDWQSTDGLLVSHIRYQGFQGNIRATTRPVSFDQSALGQILGLTQFTTWRAQGGLVVSDDLGSRAVRQFYDPAGQDFSARLVARDAFLAGSDLLYLGDIQDSNAADTPASVMLILNYFAGKYREDPTFAARVDQSVRRILEAKLRLYPAFAIANVLPSRSGLAMVGHGDPVTIDVALGAATLISPGILDLDAVLAQPPDSRDRITFLTDTHMVTQCSTCPEVPTLRVDAFEQAVLDLYGPESGLQVPVGNLESFSFDDIVSLMDGTGQPALESAVRRSGWVVLVMTGASDDQPAIIRRFLSERQDLLRNRRVILFAFTAPYYLDATDISNVSAYYVLYSKEDAFIEVAARLLYQELSPFGDSPVSVPAVGYDLITATSPDPEQVIPLMLDLPAGPTPTPDATAAPTPVPLYQVGDLLAVRTGEILDHNGHPVPDGTVVRFLLQKGGDTGGTVQQVEVVTLGGVARTSFPLPENGVFEIHVVSEPATSSEVLQLDVRNGQASAVTVVVPPPTATPSPQAPRTPPPDNSNLELTANGRPRFGAWLLSILLIGLAAGLAIWIGPRMGARRWGLRWALCITLGGLTGFTYLGLGLPGGPGWIDRSGVGAVLLAVLVGMSLGALGALAWFLQRLRPGPGK